MIWLELYKRRTYINVDMYVCNKFMVIGTTICKERNMYDFHIDV